jgi:hypothetical protein
LFAAGICEKVNRDTEWARSERTTEERIVNEVDELGIGGHVKVASDKHSTAAAPVALSSSETISAWVLTKRTGERQSALTSPALQSCNLLLTRIGQAKRKQPMTVSGRERKQII